ncbi:hypothetical protein BD769DRAFT_1678089 [Suillus cothurnatus]|nr:hypothetical protein BD769DRAFT_1678089 [Suillus cothurnatus]
MRHKHPQFFANETMHSLEWVYDTKDNSDDVNGSMVIRVGEDVSIYPLDERAVQLQDGSSLPLCLIGMVKKVQFMLNISMVLIDLNILIQDVWLDIKWYYRKVDLEDEGVDLAASVGEHELVLSDHTSLIDVFTYFVDHATILAYDEGDLAQPQNSHRTLRKLPPVHAIDATRIFLTNDLPAILQKMRAMVFNEECVASIGRQLRGQVKPRVPSTYAGINFDLEFLLLLTSPIRRGDSYGVVGNGMILVKGLALMEEAKILGRLLMDGRTPCGKPWF